MPENYTLRVKLGDSEFSAEGPEKTVKEAYQKFLDALSEAGTTAPKAKTEDSSHDSPPVTSSLLERAFQREGDDAVSLRALPPGEGDQRNADAAILLIYGFHEYLRMDNAPVTKLNKGLRKSGITLTRLDRFMDLHDGHYLKGGARSGGWYSLTNTGRQWAEAQLTSMFGNS